jgi:hypothetical protein
MFDYKIEDDCLIIVSHQKHKPKKFKLSRISSIDFVITKSSYRWAPEFEELAEKINESEQGINFDQTASIHIEPMYVKDEFRATKFLIATNKHEIIREEKIYNEIVNKWEEYIEKNKNNL